MMRPVLKIILIIFASNLVVFSTLAQSLSEQLNPAFKAYQEGQYEQAKEQFLKVLETNNDNSFILYNLGLAEYKLGNMGRALGLWNKALNLNPSFKEAKVAIEYTLSKLNPPAEQPELDGFFDVAQHKYLAAVSIHVVFLLCALMLWFFWRRFIRDLLLRRQAVDDEMVPPPFSTTTFIWGALFALLTSYAVFKAYESHLVKGIVVVQKTDAKTGPNAEQVTLFTMNEGTQVVIQEKQNNWYKIETPRAKLGWVPIENIFVTTDNY